jgi:hypothetical protein
VSNEVKVLCHCLPEPIGRQVLKFEYKEGGAEANEAEEEEDSKIDIRSMHPSKLERFFVSPLLQTWTLR